MVWAVPGRAQRVIGSCLIAGALVFAGSPGVSAAESGPCRGASAPLHTVQVHVVGRQAQRETGIKVVADLASDELGRVSGELVAGRGRQRLEVLSWCRLWSGGRGSGETESVLHVLGLAADASGDDRLVRLDLKPPEAEFDGSWKVRVRVRPVDDEHAHSSLATASDEHDDGGWQSLTGEGWLAATRVRVAVDR